MTANAPTNDGYWTDSGNYATSFAGGTGTESDPYLISTPQQLAILSYQGHLSSYRSKYYKQIADLDMSAYAFETICPLTAEDRWFTGQYDGGGYTIYNLFSYGGGLFGFASGSLQNINIVNGWANGSSYGSSGGIVGYFSGERGNGITNCHVSNFDIDSSGDRAIGGIVGEAYGVNIENCSYSGEINAIVVSVGGIVGNLSTSNIEHTNVSNCINYGNITTSVAGGGGIVGFASGNSQDYLTCSIYNCASYGNVISTASYTDLDNALNNYGTGGIVGHAGDRYQVYNCVNKGNVKGDTYVGGIIGTDIRDISLDIRRCYNSGNIEGYYVGGITGYTYVSASSDIEIYDCYNSGSITCCDDRDGKGGGIVGYTESYHEYLYIYNCYNIGDINSGGNVGGIVGGYSMSCRYNVYNSFNEGELKPYNYNLNERKTIGDSATRCYYTEDCLPDSYDGYAYSGEDVIEGTVTSSENFKTLSWFTTSSNWDSRYPWDFENTWMIVEGVNDGYPILNYTAETLSFTITYHPNGASGDEVVESKVGSEAYTISSNMFTRSGYNFTGWNTEADGSGTSYSAGSSYSELANLDLYAQWSRITYTIKYDKNASDATGSMANTTKYHGTNVTLRSNAFKRTGYSFAGWATEKNGDMVYSNGATYKANASVTLYAKWDPHKYTIVFNGNGSTSGSMKEQSFEYGTEQKLTSNAFKKTGFTFSKWTRNADGTGTSYTNGQSVKNLTSTDGAEINLWAQWKARNEAKYDSAGKYWYVENGKIPQTKVTNSTLISNLNKATTNGGNYYIAGEPLTAKVYNDTEYCKWINNWYEVEPIRWRLDASSSQKNGYGTTTDTNAVLAEIVYVDQYSSSSIDAGEGYSNQSVTDFMRNGISTTYLVNYTTSTQVFGNGTSLYGTSVNKTANMFVSSQSEITAVNGNLNITFSDLVKDIIKSYGGTNVYFTRDLGSNYNNITCFNEVGKDTQRRATEYRGVQFTVKFTEYGCVN